MPGRPFNRGSKIWLLKVLPGQQRGGKVYSVCSFRGQVDCTCPDFTKNGAVCKHTRALQALGLVAKTAKPSVVARWEESHPVKPRRRKPALLALPAPAADPAAAVPAADPAAVWVAGWRSAVHTAVKEIRAKGGVS